MIVKSQHTIALFTKNMTCNKLTMGKVSVVAVLCHSIHPSNHIRKEFPNMNRGKRLKNVVILHCEMKKIRKK